jgi:hypothetical protein
VVFEQGGDVLLVFHHENAGVLHASHGIGRPLPVRNTLVNSVLMPQ